MAFHSVELFDSMPVDEVGIASYAPDPSPPTMAPMNRMVVPGGTTPSPSPKNPSHENRASKCFQPGLACE